VERKPYSLVLFKERKLLFYIVCGILGLNSSWKVTETAAVIHLTINHV
jgi:hypothetical protein